MRILSKLCGQMIISAVSIFRFSESAKLTKVKSNKAVYYRYVYYIQTTNIRLLNTTSISSSPTTNGPFPARARTTQELSANLHRREHDLGINSILILKGPSRKNKTREQRNGKYVKEEHAHLIYKILMLMLFKTNHHLTLFFVHLALQYSENDWLINA